MSESLLIEHMSIRRHNPASSVPIFAQGLIRNRENTIRQHPLLSVSDGPAAFRPEFAIADEYERGVRYRGLMAIMANCVTGEVMADGRSFRVMYNGAAYRRRDVGELLSEILAGKRQLHGTECFTREYLRETGVLHRSMPNPNDLARSNRVTTWLEYEAGLIWTTETTNVRELRPSVLRFMQLCESMSEQRS